MTAWAPHRVAIIVAVSLVAALTTIHPPARAATTDETVVRLAGVDRFASAVAVAEEGFPSGADVVFVATGGDFPDAVVAAAGAAAVGAPVLLVGRDSVPESVREVVGGWSPSRVVVVGGPIAVSGQPFLEFVGMLDHVSIPDRAGPFPYDYFLASWYDEYPRDPAGVILHPDFDPPYHPLVIPRYATMLYADRYLAGDTASIDDALPQIRWLEDNRVADRDMDTWPVPFEAWYGRPVGWISSMYQAFTIAALLQWGSVAGSEALHSEIVDRALRVFYRDVTDGGVLTMQGPEDFWYEEYATTKRTRVLNGHFWALGGLHLAARDGGSRTAELLFEYGVNALVAHLDEYDTGFTSLYALDPGIHPNYAGPLRYNGLHIDQLLWLYHVTGIQMFYDMAERFLDYQGGALDVASVSSPAANGTDPLVVLTDGYLWSGAWTPTGPSSAITIDMRQVVTLDEVALFMGGHLEAPPVVRVATSQDGVNFGPLSAALGEPVVVGYQDAMVPSTTAFVFRVPHDAARYFRFAIEPQVDQNGEVVTTTVREINVHFDQRDRLDERYAALRQRFS